MHAAVDENPGHGGRVPGGKAYELHWALTEDKRGRCAAIGPRGHRSVSRWSARRQPAARLKLNSAPQAFSSWNCQLRGFIGLCSCQGRGSWIPSSGMKTSISV